MPSINNTHLTTHVYRASRVVETAAAKLHAPHHYPQNLTVQGPFLSGNLGNRHPGVRWHHRRIPQTGSLKGPKRARWVGVLPESCVRRERERCVLDYVMDAAARSSRLSGRVVLSAASPLAGGRLLVAAGPPSCWWLLGWVSGSCGCGTEGGILASGGGRRRDLHGGVC